MALSPSFSDIKIDMDIYGPACGDGYVDNKTALVEKSTAFYNPDNPGRSIAQAILDGQAYVESIVLHQDCGGFLSPGIRVEMTVKLCGEVEYIDSTDYPAPETKNLGSPPFGKKPPKPGLKRKIIIKAYNK